MIGPEGATDPEQAALIADAVGIALLVILDTLEPAERLVFVLHDMFALPFEEIAPLVGRSPVAARQLASRARRRVRGVPITPDADPARQRAAVDAFFAAAREGDFAGLVAVLHPEVVLRADGGAGHPGTTVLRGAAAVARGALRFRRAALAIRPALVNGAAGIVALTPHGRPFSGMGFTVGGGRIVAIDVLLDPARLRALDLAALGEGQAP